MVFYKKSKNVFFSKNFPNIAKLALFLLTSKFQVNFTLTIPEYRGEAELHTAHAKPSNRSKHEIFRHACHPSAPANAAPGPSRYKVGMSNYSRNATDCVRLTASTQVHTELMQT